MKGVIVRSLQELVETRFGKDKWQAVLSDAGQEAGRSYLPIGDVEDSEVMALLTSTCRVLGITLEQAADAFGEHWVCTFAPRMYKLQYRQWTNAREYLLKMDDVHEQSTREIKNARPPRFDYRWETSKRLVMGYKSHRNLIDILAGLARGVGKYFDEPITVTKLSDKEIAIDWP